ncbi:immunodominant staphylococcal antigen IsaB family protein [Macrococcoides canis]|uniref:immunodominant staphylococcal antigen IsaB family protein n=1 Tax=Macrococcoides canis TaxID=1855823 RepID=UPI0010FC10A7|nr:hypothetical protein [Macrococcus canis]QCT75619.1 hypothetical protein EST43_10390 [Macrococcus canis]
MKTKHLLSAAILITTLLGSVAPHTAVAKSETMQPYYTYNGFTKWNHTFVLDQYFVKSLNNGSFKINGTQLTKRAVINNPSATKHIKDTTITYSGKYVTQIQFPVQANKISKSTFMKAHKNNQLIDHNKTTVTYQTKTGIYFGTFNKNGYLTSITIAKNTTVY